MLGKPLPAAAFLFVNGLVLLLGEHLRRRSGSRSPAEAPGVRVAAGGSGDPTVDGGDPAGGVDEHEADLRSDARLTRLSVGWGVLIGCAQILALLPGISRSGATMVAGLTQQLSHRDAARFSFLLATPVILAAGVLKVPDPFGPLGNGIGGQIRR